MGSIYLRSTLSVITLSTTVPVLGCIARQVYFLLSYGVKPFISSPSPNSSYFGAVKKETFQNTTSNSNRMVCSL